LFILIYPVKALSIVFAQRLLRCLCPRLSWFVFTTFPAGKFRWKSA